MTIGSYRVMTVCTGNTHRSPMAEVVLRRRFEVEGLADVVVVDSAAVSGDEHGHPINPGADAVLVAHGYPSAATHRARQILATDLPARDLVLAMTAAHASALRDLTDASNVALYRSFEPDSVATGPGERALDIDDPFRGGVRELEQCLAQLEAAADGIVAHVRDELARRGRATATDSAGPPSGVSATRWSEPSA